MRPIQWHLKANWHVPESLEKSIPIAKSLHKHLEWWLQEDNVLVGQPLHPLQHAPRIFTKASDVGWDAYLRDFTAKDLWFVPESKLHINFLVLKAILFALKCFEHHCRNQTVLIATDNKEAYVNKERGMKLGFLCPALETPLVVQPEEHCPSGSPYSTLVECKRNLSAERRVEPLYPGIMVTPLIVGGHSLFPGLQF